MTLGAFSGNPGMTCFDMAPSAVAFANFLKSFSGVFTHAFVEFGINDAAAVQAATQNINQVSDSQNFILDGFNSVMGIPYANILWCGPWSSPAYLTTSRTIIFPRFSANCSARGCTLVDWTVVSSAGGLSTGDTVHPSQAGANLLAAENMKSIRVVA